ncbi:MAG: EamA family transporter RarD [Bdellovibrionales bacterium]|nr:EamA family transporter RarD [Bdellovibrionales bacterium]
MSSRGLIWGFISYALWGFFPLYWKLLSHRPAGEVLAHRMAWSFVFYLGIYLFFSGVPAKAIFSQSRRDWILSTLAGLILAFNWGLYIYAVNTGRILEGSLAYFINPILNVTVGVVFFREGFPLILKLSVACAAVGVALKIAYAHEFPAIALALAISFCAYGLIKKLLKIPPTTSSVLESITLFLPAVAAALYFQGHSLPASTGTWLLFAASGVVTGLPLFIFAYAAQRVPYSVMGMLQFIAPTLQFIVGVWVYNEAFNREQILAFGFIWIGVVLYMGYQVHRLRRSNHRK